MMKKYILFAMLSLSIMSVNLAPAYAKNLDLDNETLFRAYEYEKMLEKVGQKNPEALELKEEFLTLNSLEKKKYLDYMSNPKVIRKLLDTSEKLAPNTSVELYNGDIVVENTLKSSSKEHVSETACDFFSDFSSLFVGNVTAANPKVNRHVTFENNYKMFNNKIRKARIYGYINYVAQGNSVIQINSIGGKFNMFYVPYCVEEIIKQNYINTRRAHMKMEWMVQMPIVSKKWVGAVDVMGKRLHLIGDHNGSSVGNFSTF